MLDDLKILPMTPEFADMISRWKYDGIYSFYDHSEQGAEGFMDGAHFACLDGESDLVGYFCYGSDARIPTIEPDAYQGEFLDIGLGMRPDLCGRGLGPRFIAAGLEYAEAALGAGALRLSVAAFNERAIKTYLKTGFTVEREVTNSYFKNKFYIMTRESLT